MVGTTRLIWVTALDSGKPVAGAEVRVSGCDGKSLWQGRSDEQGRALIDVELPAPSCDDENFIFASARLGDDYSFVRSDWNDGIEPWRFGVETWGDYEARKIHTVLDRSLFRAGQTVSMKHIARERDSRGFAYPDSKSLPSELVIRHEGSSHEFRQALSWDKRGVATNQWKIPTRPSAAPTRSRCAAPRMVPGAAPAPASFASPTSGCPSSRQRAGDVAQLVAPREVPLALDSISSTAVPPRAHRSRCRRRCAALAGIRELRRVSTSSSISTRRARRPSPSTTTARRNA